MMSSTILKPQNPIWLLVALGVALALRVYALSTQSLWNDEGTSVALAQLSLEAITNGAARDIHPPLYYYLLHFWMPMVGTTEYAVRFLSVIPAVLTVAVVFRIARSVFDEPVAIIAAYLAALSPFQVYYSQEARMYSWVTLWAAVSVMAMLEIQRLEIKPQKTPLLAWLFYIVATTAMLYTQYVGAFVFLAENLAYLIGWLVAIRHWQLAIRSLASWLLAQLSIGALFLPWYLFAGGQLAAWPSISEPFDLPTLLWRVLNVFSVGLTLDSDAARFIAIAFAFVFVFGWRRAQAPHTNSVIVTLILWTLVPVAVMYIVSLSRPAYNPKFLLLATPPFYLLSARGLVHVKTLRYGVHFAILSLLVIGTLVSLNNYYHHPKYARDDYRTMVQWINANVRDGDGLLLDAPGQIDVVRYYLRRSPPLYLLPRMRPPDPDATRAEVDAMLEKVQRLFAILYATEQADPQAIIDHRLAERAFKARDEWHGNARLAIYGIAPARRGTPQTINLPVGEEITLQSYQLDQRQARPGDVLTFTFIWRADRTPTQRYKVFVHLLDATNRVIAQRDGEPKGDLSPTTQWRAGEIIADHYGVFIEPGTPPGEYRVEIGMYRADNGARLPIGESDHWIGGVVQVSQ